LINYSTVILGQAPKGKKYTFSDTGLYPFYIYIENIDNFEKALIKINIKKSNT